MKRLSTCSRFLSLHCRFYELHAPEACNILSGLTGWSPCHYCHGEMLTVLETLVDKEIATQSFACDLGACNGGCCTMPGGRGAPVLPAEVPLIEESVEAASEFLPERSLRVIQQLGALEGTEDDSTRCIDDRDCVFVYYEGSVAKCAIEKAWSLGRTTFRKPLSCHLFPIRIEELFGSPRLRYERLSLCQPALHRGQREGIRLFEFLEEPIVRAFGQEYYDELAESCHSWLEQHDA